LEGREDLKYLSVYADFFVLLRIFTDASGLKESWDFAFWYLYKKQSKMPSLKYLQAQDFVFTSVTTCNLHA